MEELKGVAACATANVEEAPRRVRDEKSRNCGVKGEVIVKLKDVTVVIVDL